MNDPIKVAVVGLGKIAHDQHLPVIERSPHFELVAIATPVGALAGVVNFHSVEALLESGIAVDALILSQPPQFRFEAAALGLRAGKHILLEKPPGATTLEVDQLLWMARQAGKTLFAAWHSRYAPAVEAARDWLARRRIERVHIEWREDVRHWHPGIDWIWEPGGLGVFDPGINALSIATYLITEPLRVLGGVLQIPRNRATPIAVQLELRSLSDVPIHAVFDWRETGPETWTFTAQTDGGRLQLSKGGAELHVDDALILPGSAGLATEYVGVYERFADLLHKGGSDVDVSPLRLVADAFLRCQSRAVDPFV